MCSKYLTYPIHSCLHYSRVETCSLKDLLTFKINNMNLELSEGNKIFSSEIEVRHNSINWFCPFGPQEPPGAKELTDVGGSLTLLLSHCPCAMSQHVNHPILTKSCKPFRSTLPIPSLQGHGSLFEQLFSERRCVVTFKRDVLWLIKDYQPAGDRGEKKVQVCGLTPQVAAGRKNAFSASSSSLEEFKSLQED